MMDAFFLHSIKNYQDIHFAQIYLQRWLNTLVNQADN